MIRLRSSVAYPAISTSLFEPEEWAKEDCLRAVEKIFEVTHYVMNHEMIDKLGPPFAFTLWVAARILLVDASNNKSIDSKIDYFIKILKRMGRYWKVARDYEELLSRVYDDYQSAKDGIRPASVHLLADMRRCAFDLMFSILREPREEVNLCQIRSESYHQASG